MTSIAFTESILEEAALAWLKSLGWKVKHGPEIAPGELAAVVQACLARSNMDEIGDSGTVVNKGTVHDLQRPTCP